MITSNKLIDRAIILTKTRAFIFLNEKGKLQYMVWTGLILNFLGKIMYDNKVDTLLTIFLKFDIIFVWF